MTDTYTYDVFGATKSHVGASANPYRFTGEQQGIQVARGRFTSRGLSRLHQEPPLLVERRGACYPRSVWAS